MNKGLLDNLTGPDRYVEMPDDVIKAHVGEIFVKEIRDDFYVSDMIRTDKGKWLIKLTMKMDSRWRESRLADEAKRASDAAAEGVVQ